MVQIFVQIFVQSFQTGKKQQNLRSDELVANQKYQALIAGRQPVTKLIGYEIARSECLFRVARQQPVLICGMLHA